MASDHVVAKLVMCGRERRNERQCKRQSQEKGLPCALIKVHDGTIIWDGCMEVEHGCEASRVTANFVQASYGLHQCSFSRCADDRFASN